MFQHKSCRSSSLPCGSFPTGLAILASDDDVVVPEPSYPAVQECESSKLTVKYEVEYPKGAEYFRTKLKLAFMKNRDVKDPEQIQQLLARGEFVIKELEALYMLRKYRTLKRRYYDK
ncbi:hypothetical protein LSH36_614g02021 [Paralvinella palmiformis]|uniref:Complex 1 LYR protein domain-containing protein n=1 Tax=Paralvinella palmiformis TaxID=53620 RepID=A0AAD9MUK8_9ANNE|nr:hypothetical protein LSH36_614g02021 [Paralvinella palmiformis]